MPAITNAHFTVLVIGICTLGFVWNLGYGIWVMEFGLWNLDFIWILVFGIWNLINWGAAGMCSLHACDC